MSPTIRHARTFRRAVILSVGPVTLTAGVGLLLVFTGDKLHSLNTAELAGILLLIVLPAATAWAVWMDRSRQLDRRAAPAPEEPAPAAVATSPADLIVHLPALRLPTGLQQPPREMPSNAKLSERPEPKPRVHQPHAASTAAGGATQFPTNNGTALSTSAPASAAGPRSA